MSYRHYSVEVMNEITVFSEMCARDKVKVQGESGPDLHFSGLILVTEVSGVCCIPDGLLQFQLWCGSVWREVCTSLASF